MRQRTCTARGPGGTRVAYATAGEGPALVVVQGWLTHLDLSWAIPAERAFWESLAHGRTLVRYDRPGYGLSAGRPEPATVASELATLDAVVRALDVERYELLGISLGAAVAVARAARHPAEVARLVLYGGWARGEAVAAPEVRQHVLGLVATHWGFGSDVLAEIFAPDADPATREAFRDYQRQTASARTAAEMLALSYAVDVGADLAGVRAPTLVLHRDRDRAAPLSGGRALAAGIPGARLRVLPGRSHLPYVGDAAALSGEIRRFLGLPALPQRRETALPPRQMQVAALVSAGLTNREIADRLVITERTVESHVERIRHRLDLRSRAQVAAWYVGGGGRR